MSAAPDRGQAPSSSLEHTNGVALQLPDALVEAVAERVAAKLAERQPAEPEPWLGVESAAEHLACKPDRIYDLVSLGRVRHFRDGRRLLFRREDLDAYLGGSR